MSGVIDLKPNVAKMRENEYNVTLKTTTTSRPIDIIASTIFLLFRCKLYLKLFWPYILGFRSYSPTTGFLLQISLCYEFAG